MSTYTTTLTATPIPRSASASTLLGTVIGAGNPAFQAHWAAQGAPTELMRGQTSADFQVNPIFNRVRVHAAKQGSPPRGVPR